jgi:hypothetical protein
MQIMEERKKCIIDLILTSTKFAEIGQIERISLHDIHAIMKEEKAKPQKYKGQQQQKELSSKAYKLFSEKKTTVEVAITLNLREPDVSKIHRGYWKLKRLHILNSIYKETNDKLGPFLKLYQLMKEKAVSIEQLVNTVDIAANKPPYMEILYEQVKEQIDNMQCTRQGLVNDIEARKNKISLLDKVVFSFEQECRETEQRVQELDKRERIEKLIANVLNNDDEECYSKLKQTVKENVKAVLSDNKKLISISFVALIQTIMADLEMVKLIQNIPCANDGKQHKDNDNTLPNTLNSIKIPY